MTDRSDASDSDREDVAEIPIEEWDAIVAGLERFAGERGEISEDEEGVACKIGNARFEIQRSGVVSAGMPLHDLDGTEAAALRFDHVNGAITVFAGDDTGAERFEYTFRRP